MKEFPVITEECQRLYEEWENHIGAEKYFPCIMVVCGCYGRNCLHMNEEADSASCINCSLWIFALTIDAIRDVCVGKERIEITHLRDSIILDVQRKLVTAVHVNYVYIENILDWLNSRLVE